MEVQSVDTPPGDGKKRLTLRDILSNTLSLIAQIIVQGRTLRMEEEEEGDSYDSDWLNFKIKCWKSIDQKILKLWSTTNSPTSLSVDVYSETKDPEKQDVLLHHLEQWNISYDTTQNESAKDKTINNKKSVILLRTIYAIMRQLPIYKLIRNLKSQQTNLNLKQNNNHFNIRWNVNNRPGNFPNSFDIKKPEKKPQADIWDFGSLPTKFGSLSCHVKYISDFSSTMFAPRTIIPYIIADYSPPSSSPIQILSPTAPVNLAPSRSSTGSSSSSSTSNPSSVPRMIKSQTLHSSSLESSFHQIQSPPFSNFPPNNVLTPSPTSPTDLNFSPTPSSSAPSASSSSSMPKSPPSNPLSNPSSNSFLHVHQDPLISLANVDTWSSSPPPINTNNTNNSLVPSTSTSPRSPPTFLMELESSAGTFALSVGPRFTDDFTNPNNPKSWNLSKVATNNNNNNNNNNINNNINTSMSSISSFGGGGGGGIGGSMNTTTNSGGIGGSMNTTTHSGNLANAISGMNSSELSMFLIMCNQPRELKMFSRKKKRTLLILLLQTWEQTIKKKELNKKVVLLLLLLLMKQQRIIKGI